MGLVRGNFATCEFPAIADFFELVVMVAVRALAIASRKFGVASATVIVSPDVDDVFELSKCIADNFCDAVLGGLGMQTHIAWNDTRVPGWRCRWCWYGPG